MRTSDRTWPVRLERLVWIAGTLGLLWCLLIYSRIVFARYTAAQFVSQPAPVSAQETSEAPVSTALGFEPAKGDSPAVVGRVDIPAIGISTPLLAGDNSISLTEGAGHIPGTAYPGGLGTVGIAGHRDTHFRLLRKVEPGMDVRLVDRTGTYHYRVTSSEIVTPEQVSVLDIVSEPSLVLITCFPFSYLGHAPKRFIVHAVLVSAAPDEPSAH